MNDRINTPIEPAAQPTPDTVIRAGESIPTEIWHHRYFPR